MNSVILLTTGDDFRRALCIHQGADIKPADIRRVNNGELVPSARSNCTTLPKQEYRLAGWLYRSATALCQRCEPLFR